MTCWYYACFATVIRKTCSPCSGMQKTKPHSLLRIGVSVISSCHHPYKKGSYQLLPIENALFIRWLYVPNFPKSQEDDSLIMIWKVGYLSKTSDTRLQEGFLRNDPPSKMLTSNRNSLICPDHENLNLYLKELSAVNEIWHPYRPWRHLRVFNAHNWRDLCIITPAIKHDH